MAGGAAKLVGPGDLAGHLRVAPHDREHNPDHLLAICGRAGIDAATVVGIGALLGVARICEFVALFGRTRVANALLQGTRSRQQTPPLPGRTGKANASSGAVRRAARHAAPPASSRRWVTGQLTVDAEPPANVSAVIGCRADERGRGGVVERRGRGRARGARPDRGA